MSVAKAKENLRDARRNLADAIDILPTRSLFSKTRGKRGRIRRAISATDKALAELRGS